MMKKLLLADDSITIQKVVGIIFSTEEYQLEMTDDGDSAFKKALEDIPDLVIADISMPGKDGFELCRAIKSEPSLSNTSVLLLPGAFDHFDETKAGEVCADGWLTKPFESQALLDKVSQLLDAEPVRMAGVAIPKTEETSVETQGEAVEFGDNPSLNDAALGLDVVADLAAPAEEIDEESPDDIWDAVSFAEEDLQESRETASVDSEDEVSFAADVIDPSVAEDIDTETDIEPATGEQVFSAFAADVEKSDPPVAEVEIDFVTEDSEPDNAEKFQPEPFLGVDIAAEETIAELNDQIESDSEVIPPVPAEEAEPVDFSVFSGAGDVAVESPYLIPEDENDGPFEPVDELGEGSVAVAEESDSFGAEADEDEPLELTEGDFSEQSTEVDIAEEEPVSFVAEADDEEVIMELQEEDEQEEPEPVMQDVAENVIPFTETVDDDMSDDDEIFNLSEDDIIESEQLEELLDEPMAEEVELFVASSTKSELEPELEPEFEPVDEIVELLDEEVEAASVVAEDEHFYFDATPEDDEDVTAGDVATMATGAVGLAAGVAAIHPGTAEAENSATEQVEQQLRELSEDELREVVTKVAGPMIEKLAKEMLEQIAWEVVPDLAEAMIREEIRKIKEGV